MKGWTATWIGILYFRISHLDEISRTCCMLGDVGWAFLTNYSSTSGFVDLTLKLIF